MTAGATTERSRAVVHRAWTEFFIGGRLDLAEEFFAPDYVNHDPSVAGDRHGPREIRDFLAAYREAFPDMAFTVEDVIAAEDRVVVRWTVRGTHRGALGDLPATGRRIEVDGVSIERVAGGRIVETWDLYDTMGLMQQLGVVSEAAAG